MLYLYNVVFVVVAISDESEGADRDIAEERGEGGGERRRGREEEREERGGEEVEADSGRKSE